MVETALEQITYLTKTRPQMKFTSLCHHLNEAMLKESFQKLRGSRAPGVDAITKEEYGKNLNRNLQELIRKLKARSYRPKPVRRVMIPKPGSDKMHPLGIPTLEDCLVQDGIRRILEAIYEPLFLNMSYGSRPARSAHMAIAEMGAINKREEVFYCIEVDVKSYFDEVNQEQLITFLKHRIADERFLNLLQRVFKSGVEVEGRVEATPKGVPQGGVASGVLANIYLHYTFDLWFEKAVKPRTKGAWAIRYMDDILIFVKEESDLERILTALKQRLGKFSLTLSETKTKVIRFGILPAWRYGLKALGTIPFLGFTHFIRRKPRTKKLILSRKTSQKSFTKGLKSVWNELKRNRNRYPIQEILDWVYAHLRGHFEYFGVTDNSKSLSSYRDQVKRITFYWLNRRSDRRSFDWETFGRIWNRKVPKYHIHLNLRPGA